MTSHTHRITPTTHRGDEALVDLPEVDDEAKAGGEEDHPGGVVVE